MVSEEMPSEDICSPRKPGFVVFPEYRNITAAMSLCERMKAKMGIVTSPEVQAEMTRVYITTFSAKNSSEGKSIRVFIIGLRLFRAKSLNQ